MASFAAPNMSTSSQLLTKKDAIVNGLESHQSGGQATSSVKRIDEETPVDSSAGISNNRSRCVFCFLHDMFLKRIFKYLINYFVYFIYNR